MSNFRNMYELYFVKTLEELPMKVFVKWKKLYTIVKSKCSLSKISTSEKLNTIEKSKCSLPKKLSSSEKLKTIAKSKYSLPKKLLSSEKLNVIRRSKSNLWKNYKKLQKKAWLNSKKMVVYILYEGYELGRTQFKNASKLIFYFLP